MAYQRLDQFTLPKGFRGRSALVVQLWWLVQATLFAWSPQFCYGWRAFLLRLFGASVGKKTVIRPSVRVTYPWRVTIGDYVWIGDNAELYSLGEISLGDHCVVSQRGYLCAGSHDYTSKHFAINAKKIVIEREAWMATDVFVGPGVTIGSGTVVGARSSVYSNLPAGKVCFGSPAKVIKNRC